MSNCAQRADSVIRLPMNRRWLEAVAAVVALGAGSRWLCRASAFDGRPECRKDDLTGAPVRHERRLGGPLDHRSAECSGRQDGAGRESGRAGFTGHPRRPPGLRCGQRERGLPTRFDRCASAPRQIRRRGRRARGHDRPHPAAGCQSGQDPENLALTPDGQWLVVSNEEDGEASVIELSSGKRIGALPTGAEPEGVACRPDGKVCYVTSEDEGSVTVVDPQAFKVIASFKVDQRPRAVVFTSDGRLAFVTAEASRNVTKVDALNHVVLHSLRIDGPQVKPMGIAITGDDRTLYVTTGRGGSAVAIDVPSFKIAATFGDVGQRPWGVAVESAAHHLFTANGPSNDVSVIDLSSGKVLQRIPAGTHPWGLALFAP